MKINWILQENITHPIILQQLKSAIQQDNTLFEEVQIIPFSNQLPNIQSPDTFKIPYGSTTFMLTAFQDKNWKSGVFYDPDTFQMKNYVKKWKNHVLNSDGTATTLGQLHQISSSPSQKWFIRPNHDGKEFNGKVDTFDNLIKWANQIISLNLFDINAQTEVWISPPKIIKKEWRLFIVNNRIVSACRYLLLGDLNESRFDIPSTMLSFANARIQEYHLSDVYVMDIAEVENSYKIIECNCFNGTGFYQNDIKVIVKAINDRIRNKANI